MDRLVDLGRLRNVSEKILIARQDRAQFIVKLKQTVADLRKGFIEENSAIHRAWFGPSVAEKVAEAARANAIKAIEESVAKAVEVARVQAIEVARVKAAEEARAKAAEVMRVQAIEEAKVKAVEAARVQELADMHLAIKPLAIVADMIRAEKIAESEKAVQEKVAPARVLKPLKNKHRGR